MSEISSCGDMDGITSGQIGELNSPTIGHKYTSSELGIGELKSSRGALLIIFKGLRSPANKERNYVDKLKDDKNTTLIILEITINIDETI